MSVAAIIVAAGASSRLGQPKQLVLLGGEPLLQRAVRFAREAGAAPVFVVLGAHREQIEKAIAFGDAQVIVNGEWKEGLASSIRAGVKAVELDARAGGVLLMTCDQPRVTAEHLRRLIDEFHAKDQRSLIVSTYTGIRGTPAIFPPAMFSELLALRGDKGARTLLSEPLLLVIEVELKGGEIDIDRPEDLVQLV